MPRFTYVSRDSTGQKISAVAEADTRQSLLGQLKDQGLTVVEIKELGDQSSAVSTGPRQEKAKGKSRQHSAFERGVSTAELSVFWREFATMVGAGIPVVEAIESIARETEHKRLHKVLLDVVSGMWEGFTLSESLRKHPGIFSPMIVALIGSAEESGSLVQVSNQLATYLENRDRLFRKVRAALTYPIFLCGFFVVVIAISTIWVIPMFQEIYAGLDAKLPWITRIVFAANTFFLKNLWWFVASTAIALLALVLWARTAKGRQVLDRISLRLPIFGQLLQRASVSRLCRSLSILLAGGVPVARALEMAEETAGNTVVAKAIRDSREEILKGSKIAHSFKQHKIFPQMAIRMISAGEETGSLDSLLEKVADFYESRVDATLTTINTLIEPIMIIIVGAFVLVFVLSMYMPIFSLAATMKG